MFSMWSVLKKAQSIKAFKEIQIHYPMMRLLCCCSAGCFPKSRKIGKLSREELKWLASHTNYSEDDVQILYKGFLQDYPNGGISRRQFERFFQGTGDAQNTAEIVFKTIDFNGNGYLDFKELILAVDLIAAKNPEEKLSWAFKIYDLDNSGVIDEAEMEKVMKAVYDMLAAVSVFPDEDPKVRANRMFEEIDVDSDGTLTLEEFLKGCRKDDELMLMMDNLFKNQ